MYNFKVFIDWNANAGNILLGGDDLSVAQLDSVLDVLLSTFTDDSKSLKKLTPPEIKRKLMCQCANSGLMWNQLE